MSIEYRSCFDIPVEKLVALYRANEWSSADKPIQLHRAMMDSHSVVTAWAGHDLVGLGNAISDGHLVVYYPHLLVHPDYRGQGIGSEIVRRLRAIYDGYHQQMVVADGRAIEFYRKCGFVRAGRTEPMWIYAGNEH